MPISFSLLVSAVAVAVVLVSAAPAAADTFKVTRTGDPAPGNCKPNDCSLREAVLAANNDSAGGDTVVLPNRERRYELTIPNGTLGSDEDGGMEGDLDVTNEPLTILHRGKGLATIDANGHERVMEAFSRLTLRRLKLTGGGYAPSLGDGGAILSGETVRLELFNTRLVDNAGDDGGAIELGGSLKLVRSRLIGNRSEDDAGAIRFASTTGTPHLISRSVFDRNVGDDDGGALDVSDVDTRLRIDRSTFTRNRMTAGDGGGALDIITSAPVAITNSTFAGNRTVDDGGAISIGGGGNTRITNSTIAGNRADGHGGAIARLDPNPTALKAVTIVRNVSDADMGGAVGAGGGLFDLNGGTEISNSLIALNDQRGGDADDCAGTFVSLGGNLRTDATDCGGFDHPTDLVRANPKIEGLAKNGGPTKTVALKAGSPAIGEARKSLAPGRDQRGRKRDSKPDIGAFERGA